ncbi:MAG TPA: GatB/YqeY domain-containing protein [Burkholderiales bacterium]|nr:GatB/YqeY domain-containing protein [Burkholderiales bacterium]
MPIKSKVVEDMKAAMKAREAQRLSGIRLLLAAIKQREVDERKELADAEVVAVVEKMIKQRRDSIAQFQTAGRKDLVDNETYELNLLSGYLPNQLTDAELAGEVSAAMVQTGAKGMSDMGKVMGVLKGKLAGRADMGKVSALVKAKLAG